MIKNKKYNILIMISFLILLLAIIYSAIDYNKQINYINEKNIEMKQKYCLGAYEKTEYEQLCKNVLKQLDQKNIKPDFFTAFTNIFIFGANSNKVGLGGLSFILILFIIIPSLYYVCRYLKNSAIINESTRKEYGKNKTNLFKNAYKPALILPFIAVIGFILCYFYSSGFNPAYAVEKGTTGLDASTMHKPGLFIILYIFNLLVHSVLFINISLIISRKYHNCFISLILSFLSYIALDVFLEVAIGGILMSSILKLYNGMIMFNIVNMVTFNDVNGIFSPVIVPLVLAILSSLVVSKLYNNKEKLIIDCEKNVQEEA